MVHRLDQPVSGILVFAKTKQAAAELGRQITSGKMHKYYYAVVYGMPDVQKERLENFLYKNAKTNLSLIVEEGIPNAKKAVLEYKLVKSLIALEENAEPEEISLIEIKLITGRHHQIRAQMSHAGMPLIGDNKYGNDKSKNLSYEIKCRNVSLCAYKLEFFHPVSMKKITFEKQPEEDVFTPFLPEINNILRIIINIFYFKLPILPVENFEKLKRYGCFFMDKFHLSETGKKYLLTGAIIFIVYFAMKYISPIISPFIFAFLLAGALNPLVRGLGKK